MVIAANATPTHWAFYFLGSGLPLSVCGPWSGSMCRDHIALQELWAVPMMLCRMAFHLSGKMVALHFDNNTDKDLSVYSRWYRFSFSFQAGLLDTESH